MSILRTIRESRLRAASIVASLLVHAAAYGAAVVGSAWLIRQLPLESTSLAGRRQVVNIQAAWSISQPVTAPESFVIVEPVQVSPTEAVVEQRRLVATASAEVVLPAVETPVAALTVGEPPSMSRQQAQHEPEAAAAAESMPPERLPAVDPPIAATSVAALPQTAGTDATRPPKFAGNRPPNYPLVAQQRGWEGTVLLALAIDERGQVTAVTIERSSGYAVLDAEAVAAIRQWRGEPATRNGEPVATEETLPVRFRLR